MFGEYIDALVDQAKKGLKIDTPENAAQTVSDLIKKQKEGSAPAAPDSGGIQTIFLPAQNWFDSLSQNQKYMLYAAGGLVVILIVMKVVKK